MNTTDHEEIQSKDANRRGELHHGGFAEGTLVHTKEGLRSIETMQVGDWVLSFPSTQLRPKHVRTQEDMIFRQVTTVSENTAHSLYEMVVFNLASGKKETIWTNADQQIWCKGLGWTPATKMEQAGDVLDNFRYRNVIVYRCKKILETRRVFTLGIDELHTFYAGEQGIWVHDLSK